MAVGFHFLLLAIGEILKTEEYVTAQDIQDFIQNDDAFGVRLPLNQCRLALELMENSMFIVKVDNKRYMRFTGSGVK